MFPFTYRGETYYDCITKDFNREWCSLDEDYDKHKRFGLCGKRTFLISQGFRTMRKNVFVSAETRNSLDLQVDR